ncbi:MAG TPA: hypothetical protein VE645_05215 [Pseudonocardiaceae bacterium]|jgi:hypothetical protein|nr:hypothetical protein [Pseudonocardiaceae bacterium]
MATQTFPFRFTTPYRLAGLPFGITPATAAVQVRDGDLAIRFGLWRVRTALTNVAATTVTGPFGFIKTAGPAHLSFADRGLTMATNGTRGLCITFREPVRGIEPTGALRHPAVTVTVADCQHLAAVLASQ